MPRAHSICLAKGCTSRTFRDGRCREHQTRKSWDRVSKRNQSRPKDINTRRAKVLARDRFTCQKCGSRKDLEVDHIIPVAKGGTWDLENLWVLCADCHGAKTRKFDRGHRS